MLLENTIHLGDCLELMKQIPDASIDLILCDLPYGTTACKWDSVIPFEALWAAYNRIAKEHTAIVLTGSEPFSSRLRMSQIGLFKYDWVWDKVNLYTGALLANKQPLKRHELIHVFYKKQPTYNKQWRKGTPYSMTRNSKGVGEYATNSYQRVKTINEGKHNPCTILEIEGGNKSEKGLHPTQKPVALFEYLIKTYTNPGDLVLDNCAGSGTTAVACKQTGRRYLCIEKDRDYWLKACERVSQSLGFNEVSPLASQTVIEPNSDTPLA